MAPALRWGLGEVEELDDGHVLFYVLFFAEVGSDHPLQKPRGLSRSRRPDDPTTVITSDSGMLYQQHDGPPCRPRTDPRE